MGMVLSPEDVHRAVEAVRCGQIVPDGPVIPAFDPCELSFAIEQECRRVGDLKNPSLTLVFDPEDAIAMIRFLKSSPISTRFFETRALAEEVENKFDRSGRKQNQKLVINMPLEGALALAKFLRFRTAG